MLRANRAAIEAKLREGDYNFALALLQRIGTIQRRSWNSITDRYSDTMTWLTLEEHHYVRTNQYRAASEVRRLRSAIALAGDVRGVLGLLIKLATESETPVSNTGVKS